MTLSEFLALPGSKYAVMSKARYQADPVLETYAYSPGEFLIGGVAYVAMNVEPTSMDELAVHLEGQGNTIVFSFTMDSDKVAFLTQAQVLEVKRTLEDPDPNPSPVSVPDAEA